MFLVQVALAVEEQVLLIVLVLEFLEQLTLVAVVEVVITHKKLAEQVDQA
jgi:hypothetical protein